MLTQLLLPPDKKIEKNRISLQKNTVENSIIAVRNLSVRISGHEILKNIDLDIPSPKIVVLLGPSGCGKTTLLKSMNRLTDLNKELHVTGKIFIDGKDILKVTEELPLMRQKMGLLSQRPFPLPMSIFRNVSYGLKLQGARNKKLIAADVENNLRKVGLWEEVKDRLNSSAGSLSIGQQQRLCLARGLAVRPTVILADEPTSALDPIATKTIEDLFRQLKKNYTILLVTHSIRQAVRLADHVIFMYDGQIIEQGPPEVIFRNPSTEILRRYLIDGN